MAVVVVSLRVLKMAVGADPSFADAARMKLLRLTAHIGQ